MYLSPMHSASQVAEIQQATQAVGAATAEQENQRRTGRAPSALPPDPVPEPRHIPEVTHIGRGLNARA